MSKMQTNGIPKKQEWEREPDELDFEAHGLRCRIVRGTEQKHLCGYVSVKPGHLYFEKEYDDVEATVHGGLTFSDSTVKGDESPLRWWFGFDCAHAGDMLPGLGHVLLMRCDDIKSGTYRNMEYVKAECESLAQQLSEVSP